MPEVEISAEMRDRFGKGPARRVRRAGRVPAVLYGHGKKPRHLNLPGHELMLALKGGSNTLLRVHFDGDSELALPRAIVRDPIKGFLEHLDLLVVERGELVSVSVPVTVTGEPVPDSLVDLQMPALPVEAEATHIPTGFEVSVEGLKPGDSVTAGQVHLAANVRISGDSHQVVVQILAAPTAEELLPEETAEAEAAEEAAAEGAAAGESPDQAGGGEPGAESPGAESS